MDGTYWLIVHMPHPWHPAVLPIFGVPNMDIPRDIFAYAKEIRLQKPQLGWKSTQTFLFSCSKRTTIKTWLLLIKDVNIEIDRELDR